MKRSVFRRSVLPLAALGATVSMSRRTGFFNMGMPISRRALLRLGGLAVAGLVGGAWRRQTSADASTNSTFLPAVSCVLTPEQTQGPYYIAREKVRSNITEHRSGTPLKLRFTVVDAATCKPVKGAAVDIWHCDAGGIYSGFEAASTGAPGGSAGPTDKHTFLRGIQFTNAGGHAGFQTIYPGWYRGRTVHIHVKVHLGHHAVGHVAHTGQLYFSDVLTGKVYRSQPYKARATARDTFNNNDGIFQNGGAQSMLSMKRDGHGGYIGTIVLGVRRP